MSACAPLVLQESDGAETRVLAKLKGNGRALGWLWLAFLSGCVAYLLLSSTQQVLPPEVNLAELNGTESRLKQIILNPELMYETYGFMPIPVAFMSLKGYINFGIALLLFLGTTVFHGWPAMQAKAKADMKFTWVSALFQALGLFTTLVAYGRIAQITKPWQGWDNWGIFSYLVSQHSATITLLSGIGNNVAVLIFHKWAADEKGYLVRCLLFSGIVLSVPLVLAWLTCCWSSQLPVVLVAFALFVVGFAFMLKSPVTEIVNIMRMKGGLDEWVNVWGICLLGTTFSLATLWLVAAQFSHNACLLFGAILLELFGPLVVLVLFLMLTGIYQKGCGTNGLLMAFVASMCAAFIVSMTVPAGLLSAEEGIGDAVVEGFMTRKLFLFGENMVMHPAEKFAGKSGLSLWFSQIISYFS